MPRYALALLATLAAVLVVWGFAFPKSVPADYPPTSRYGGDVLSYGSNDEILIAGTESENREAKSLIQSLEGFLLSNTRNNDRTWWLSTSGSISVTDEDDGVLAIIPGLMVVFNLGKEESPLEIGDLEIHFRAKSNEILNIAVQFPSHIRLRNPDGSVGAEMRIDSSQFTLDWNTALNTIIENQIDFRGISFSSNNIQIAQVESIESIGKLDEGPKGSWSGFLKYRMENLVSTLINIEEVESQESVKNLLLREFTNAIKEIDSDGRFGSWFYGGAFYPTKMYEYAISRENVISFIDATRKALPAMGDVSIRAILHNFSMPGLFSITDIRSQGDNHRNSSGLVNSAMQLKIDGIHVPENPENIAFQGLIPSSVNLDLDLDRMPEISLVDILRTVTIDALKENWSVMSKREKDDAQIPDLGPGQGTQRPQTVYLGDRH